MKQEEINALTRRSWIIKFVTMQPKQLTIEVIRQRGGQWYRLASGGYFVSKDLGNYSIPGCIKINWPETQIENYILDTDSFPDYANDVNAMIELALKYRNENGDPYRLNLEMDDAHHKRWLAIFRKHHAYAWGDSPAEALCRAYLLEYEIASDWWSNAS